MKGMGLLEEVGPSHTMGSILREVPCFLGRSDISMLVVAMAAPLLLATESAASLGGVPVSRSTVHGDVRLRK